MRYYIGQTVTSTGQYGMGMPVGMTGIVVDTYLWHETVQYFIVDFDDPNYKGYYMLEQEITAGS